MKHLYLAAAILLPLSANAAEPQNGSGETDGYKLVWQDLFDSGSLNDLRWNIEVNGNGGGNNELQYYTDRESNVRVGDDGKGNGCLILTARRESYNGKNFTSGRVNSMNFTTFTHGKIEAAIKLPVTSNGLWPAFWMMGNDWQSVGWPKCGETDILEMGHSNGFKNGVGDRFFNGACHWGTKWPQYSYAKDATKSYSLQDGEFHLFTLIWDETSYRMYVDLDRQPVQTPYYQIDITKKDPNDETSPGNYFHKDNFLIFNLAIGGNFPGIYDAAGITAINDANGQEASMYINYVKVYQKGNASDSFFSAVPGDELQGTNPNDPIVTPPNLTFPEPSGEYGIHPAMGNSLGKSEISHLDYIILDPSTGNDYKNKGTAVQSLAPDGGARNLYTWENTFALADSDYPSADGNNPSHKVFTVTNADWSGAGFNVGEAAGFSTNHWTDATRFHLAYRSPEGSCPTIAFRVAESSQGAPAQFSVGNNFRDGDNELQSIGAGAENGWRGIDLSLGDLKKKCPGFEYVRTDKWSGNILDVLAGGGAGKQVSLDAAYFYNTQLKSSVAENASDIFWLLTGCTLNVNGKDACGIRVYDMCGKMVLCTSGCTVGTEGLEPGIYIACSGDSAYKFLIK